MTTNTTAADGTLHFNVALSDDTLVRYFNRCHESASKHASPWREKLPRLFGMYGGRMLSEADRKVLKGQQRPPIEFNFALGTLNAILGQDMANRSEVVYRGDDLSPTDGNLADWMTQLGKHYLGRCRALMHEWDAMHEMLVTGYGWSAGFLNVNVIPLRPVLERVHCWEMYPDPDATEDNLVDARFLIRKRSWSLEEAEARWPDKVSDLRTVANASSRMAPAGFPKLWRNDEWRRFNASDDPSARLSIYEFQYKRYEPYVRFFDDTTGDFTDLPEADWQKRMGALGKIAAPDGLPNPDKPDGYPYAKECVYRAFIVGEGDAPGAAGGYVLQHTKLSVPTFTYNALTGFKDKDPDTGRVTFFGPGSVIYDAQHYINRSLSLILEIVATSSKGGGFIERSALTGSVESFQRDNAKPGYFHVVEDGAVSDKRIMLKPVSSVPPVISEFLRLCMDALGRLTGVTDWVKGTATSERSNVLINNLQNQSMTLLLPLFEPLAQFRMSNGVLLNRIALAHLPVQEIDRVLNAEPVEGLTHQRATEGNPQDPTAISEQWVPLTDPQTNQPVTAGSLLKQRDPHDYDVAADVGQASPTMKMLFWSVMSQGEFVDMLRNTGVPLGDFAVELLRFSPLPTGVANKLADKLEQSLGERPMDPQQLLQALAQLHPADRMQVLQAAWAQAQQQGIPQQAGATAGAPGGNNQAAAPPQSGGAPAPAPPVQ